MSDVSKTRVGEMQRGVIKLLLDSPDGLPAKDAIERLRVAVPPTDFEKTDYPNRPGSERYRKMVRFATIAPVKAGWMIKDEGRWYITEDGIQAYQKFKDPLEFRREAGRLYHQWKDNRPKEESESEDDSADAVEILDKDANVAGTYEEAEETAWTEIEQYVQIMKPYDLQKLVAALLRAMGYYVSWVAPPGPDGGIDILAHNDPLGTTVPRIKVQVKRRADRVAINEVREFISVLSEHDVGIFVSIGGFTKEAETKAREKETRILTLLDLRKFVDLWIKNYAKIEESDKRLLPLEPVYYLAPSE
jgi:restriction system protein